MSQNKWVRSISFNRMNEKDIARLSLIGKKSFSRFIKRLLDDEIKRQNVPINELVPVTTTKVDTPILQQRVIPPNTPLPVRPQNQHYQQTPRPYNPMLQGQRRE
ncbi:hypothetical protein [Bacillus solitudinis]|uniref:hypothetical protein n=1 Tax=Bacillus solitudinis TaxID=2014074 RepID=UPI000C230BDF|nr:hypothetical protein [Bacillus solitudinis]